MKYFYEDASEYHIVAAGSLLGVSLHSVTGFPVGKVDELKMYPLSFAEFIEASGKPLLCEMLKAHQWTELSSIASTYEVLLRQYYYVGGMAEVVDAFFSNNDLAEVRTIQKRILRDYEQDFSKHIPESQVPKVRLVWNSIPAQLAKENKKIIYAAFEDNRTIVACRFSMAGYRKQEWLTNVPLCFASEWVNAFN